MARKKDLGGLAALAGLAYMASRDKAAEPEKEYRSDPFGEMTQEERDARQDINGRTLAEENYGNESRRPIRTPVRSAAPRAPSASSPSIVDQETGMRGYKPRYTPPGRAPKTTEGARSSRLNAQELDDYTEYKKGGSVKGWGIARGARKAKNY